MKNRLDACGSGSKLFGVEVESIIGSLLRGGVLLSGAVIAFGMVLLFLPVFAPGAGPRLDVSSLLVYAPQAAPFPTTIGSILSGVARLDPPSIILVGATLLVLTPVLRVAVHAAAFLEERDYDFVAITVFVLVVMAASLAVGRAL